MNILIVEDDESIANLIKINLSAEGYQCTCAFDGKVGADYIEREAFDLILLDIMLPEINGYELLEYIKPFGTPVIFITAKGSVTKREIPSRRNRIQVCPKTEGQIQRLLQIFLTENHIISIYLLKVRRIKGLMMIGWMKQKHISS